MAITIKKVSSKKELKTFIRFNYELYKENPYSVPDSVSYTHLTLPTTPYV